MTWDARASDASSRESHRRVASGRRLREPLEREVVHREDDTTAARRWRHEVRREQHVEPHHPFEPRDVETQCDAVEPPRRHRHAAIHEVRRPHVLEQTTPLIEAERGTHVQVPREERGLGGDDREPSDQLPRVGADPRARVRHRGPRIDDYAHGAAGGDVDDRLTGRVYVRRSAHSGATRTANGSRILLGGRPIAAAVAARSQDDRHRCRLPLRTTARSASTSRRPPTNERGSGDTRPRSRRRCSRGASRSRAFVNDPRESHLQPPLSDLPTRSARLPRKRWRLRAAASYFGGPALDRVLPGVELFHATEHLLPKLTRARSVFTLHDVAYLLFPEHHLPRNRIYLRTMMPRFLRRADRVIAVSESTRTDALRSYPLRSGEDRGDPGGRGASLPARCRSRPVARVRRPVHPPRTVHPDGRHDRASEEPRDPRGGVRLAPRPAPRGRPGHRGQEGLALRTVLRARASARTRRSRRVHRPRRRRGHARPAERGRGLRVPSEFEGFGLPPLEAMACGIPVVSFGRRQPSGGGGRCGHWCRPGTSPAGWRRSTASWTTLRSAPGSRPEGVARARRFSWDTAAERTLEVYRSVMAEGR